MATAGCVVNASHALRRFVAIVLASTVGVLLLFGAIGQVGWSGLVYNAVAGMLFSVLIAGPLQLILPRIAPLISKHTTAPFNWALLVTVMMSVAAGGSAVAIVILISVGWVPAAAFGSFFRASLRVSFAITLTFGIGIVLYEQMRKRARDAELALRTKERDEAEARRVATEAQLASLESRVQPHFLFNTLNSIAALIPDDPTGAERMTGQLASLLRSSMDTATTPLVPVAQELKSVRDYLDIERVRFGDRLRFAIEVPPELGGVLVPRFALQTLVENSVKFAVTPRREGGLVTLRSVATATHVQLVVEDDGPGFNGASTPDHHGLALARERLRLSFGERAGLVIDSRAGCTRVTVTVPR